MRRNTKIAAAATAGALALGGLLAVGPVAAGTGDTPAPYSTVRQHRMTDHEHHTGQPGDGLHDARRDGSCTVLTP
ncbi:hypothetical protein [Streptomyces sediminimaris]|uniref:hypothetical protein n=1 Tax=Streptomyces sediminimaris TaxID=3383721 RepID=UPI00399B4985